MDERQGFMDDRKREEALTSNSCDVPDSEMHRKELNKPMQRMMYERLKPLIHSFYADPENERRYSEWLKNK